MSQNDQWAREARFHDRWAASTDHGAVPVDACFHGPTALENRFILSRLGDVRGKRLLDIGCGLGESSVAFALMGARVTATDLSPGMVESALRLAELHGVTLDGRTGAAEALDLEPGSFDIIYTANTIHHLTDQNAFLAGAVRLLANDGVFCSWDPVRYNPVINIYRRMATEVRTEDERPLGTKEIALVRRHFSQVETRHFWLLGLSLFIKYYILDRVSPNAERYWKRIYHESPRSLRWWLPLAWIDRHLLRLPLVNWLSWNVVVIARHRPNQPGTSPVQGISS